MYLPIFGNSVYFLKLKKLKDTTFPIHLTDFIILIIIHLNYHFTTCIAVSY